MSDSYKKLVIKAQRGSRNADEELKNRSSLYIDTGLNGISNESIVYRYNSDINESISYIINEINNIRNNKSYTDIVLLDAYSSATIEGARTTIDRVKRCFNNPVSKSDKMVVNAIRAQNFVYNNVITQNNIRNIWECLVEGVCENEDLKGIKYRNGMVYVASRLEIIHTPEKVENIESKMNDLFNFYIRFNNSIIKACIIHFYFVYIHPFCDGNGRFARLWMNKILSDINVNFRGLVLSQEINKSLTAYYSSIHESEYSYNGLMDVTPFIEYMLDIIANSIDYLSTKRYVKLSNLDNLILSKLNRDGMTISKLSRILNEDRNKVRYSVNKLVNNKMLYVDKTCKEYRYYKNN